MKAGRYFEKCVTLGVLIASSIFLLFGQTPATAADITGAYSGEIRDDEWMVLVREIGASAYRIGIYMHDETISFPNPNRLSDSRYELMQGAETAIMEFYDDAIGFLNQNTDETLLLTKLSGELGEMSGKYIFPLDDSMGLIIVDEENGSISVDLEGWDYITDAYSDAQAGNVYELGRYKQYVLSFESDHSCTLKVDDEEHVFRKTAALHPAQRHVPVGEEGIAGLYRGGAGPEKVMLLSRPIGNSLYELNLMDLQEEVDFGSGKVRVVDGERQLETEQLRIDFTSSGLNFHVIEIGETLDFQKITDLEQEDVGIYLYEDIQYGFIMLLTVDSNGDHHSVKAEVWQTEEYFDTRLNNRHVYIFEDEYYSFLFAFADNACRVIFEDTHLSLSKVASLADKWKAEEKITGIIPDLAMSDSMDKLLQTYFPGGPPHSHNLNAGQIKIDPSSTIEVSFDGLQPKSISPNGIHIFAVGDESAAIFDTTADRFVFREEFPSTRFDFPASRWSPDGTRIAFAEDYFRTRADADIHMIFVDKGEHKNLTDDGISQLDIARGEGVIDNLPFWLEGGEEFVFLRTQLGNSLGPRLMKFNIYNGTIEAISAKLTERSTITTMFFDLISGKIFFTKFGQHPEDQGVCVLDPKKQEPAKIVSSDESGISPTVVSDLSLNGKWLMLFFPTVSGAPDSYPGTAAFSLFDIQSGSMVPILGPDNVESNVINNAVFSPDGSKVLFVYGERSSAERHIAAADTGASVHYDLYEIEDPTAGISPTESGGTGTVGLRWCNDDSLFVSVDFGEKALILKP